MTWLILRLCFTRVTPSLSLTNGIQLWFLSSLTQGKSITSNAKGLNVLLSTIEEIIKGAQVFAHAKTLTALAGLPDESVEKDADHAVVFVPQDLDLRGHGGASTIGLDGTGTDEAVSVDDNVISIPKKLVVGESVSPDWCLLCCLSLGCFEWLSVYVSGMTRGWGECGVCSSHLICSPLDYISMCHDLTAPTLCLSFMSTSSLSEWQGVYPIRYLLVAFNIQLT